MCMDAHSTTGCLERSDQWQQTDADNQPAPDFVTSNEGSTIANPTKYTLTFVAISVLAAVFSLSFALSSSLDSRHAKSDLSHCNVMYWLGFAGMVLAIFSRGVIYVVARTFQGHDVELWKKKGKKKSMQPMDIAVMIVLFVLTSVAAAEIIRTLVFTALFIHKCKSEPSAEFSNSVTAATFCYDLASLVFFFSLLYLFFTKSRYDISDSKGSEEKVTAIFAVSIFAVLFIGLEKFLDYVTDVGLPFKRTTNRTCDDINRRYVEAERSLRPFYMQLCVVLLFFLLAKVAKSSKKAGVLHFWSTTPLRKLNQLGGESKINYDSLKPLVKRFFCILVVALGATLAWSSAFISTGLTKKANYYAVTNLAEFIFSSVLCLLGFGILKKITDREPKQSFDVFIAVGLISTSCFPVLYCLLSIYANFACLHNCSLANASSNINIPLQIVHLTSNLTAVSVQVVLTVTIRKLAKDLWSLKVHTTTEQERIHMNAKTSIYTLYVYPFIMAYMAFINFARYLIDLSLEGPISEVEDVIYGKPLWKSDSNLHA
ncbi:uncharacterized protein [Oscarella lobularis]|uniref:uncharacterized protein n=1 Tax=Oscarella lobularis TaxID=121494 RepID=UPI00331416F1